MMFIYEAILWVEEGSIAYDFFPVYLEDMLRSLLSNFLGDLIGDCRNYCFAGLYVWDW
jgi:hypothetical protein